MKIVAIVLIVIRIIDSNAFEISDDWLEAIEDYKKSCAKETGVDKDTADRIVRNKSVNRNHATDCFSACFVDRIVKFRGEGQIDIGHARKSARDEGVDVENVISAMEKCNGLFGKDFCETGYNTLKCLIDDENFPKLYPSASKEL